MNDKNPRYIVAEISKSWHGQDRIEDAVSHRFEQVIAVNLERGYTLHSWKLVQTMVPVDMSLCGEHSTLVETIVAVFEWTEALRFETLYRGKPLGEEPTKENGR